MKFRIVAVGKVREPYTAAAVEDFYKRLRRYEPVELIEVAASNGADVGRAIRDESARILKALEPGDAFWLLERTGAELSSLELAERLAAMNGAGPSRLVLGIAGTYGASAELRARADFAWSLSRLTFLHEWARALVLEQLYRAAKIARNEPYHH